MAQERGIQKAPSEGWQGKDEHILLAAGFEPARGVMWQKEGVLYGREAALQYAKRELRDKGESHFFDQT
jgi:hypothetical protein